MQLNGAALRAIRERSGMTVASLARAVAINPNHLSNIEAGRRNASPETALALAKALKVELPAILAEAVSAEVYDARMAEMRNASPEDTGVAS